MTHGFDCPHCGGAIEYVGSGRSIKCTYCGRSVPVPEALWQPIEHAKSIGQWKTFVLVFLIITLVLPTFVSLLAKALGVGGGLLAVFSPFVIRLMGGN